MIAILLFLLAIWCIILSTVSTGPVDKAVDNYSFVKVPNKQLESYREHGVKVLIIQYDLPNFIWNDEKRILSGNECFELVQDTNDKLKFKMRIKPGNVFTSDLLGMVTNDNLHLELYEHKYRGGLQTWRPGKTKPDQLLDPTDILLNIQNQEGL